MYEIQELREVNIGHLVYLAELKGWLAQLDSFARLVN